MRKLVFSLLVVAGVSFGQISRAPGSSQGGVTLPSTSALLKGNGSGGAVAATAGTDYLTSTTGVTTVNGSSGAVTTVTAPATGIVKSNGTALQTATAGTDYLSPSTGVTSVNGSTGAVTTTITIASGTAALGTSAIASGACATAVTSTATGVATTDTIMADFNADPTAITGYVPSTNGILTIIKYPTSGNVNFKVCNMTSASVTPGAVTLNWRVVR